jgi:hypothetical protein
MMKLSDAVLPQDMHEDSTLFCAIHTRRVPCNDPKCDVPKPHYAVLVAVSYNKEFCKMKLYSDNKEELQDLIKLCEASLESIGRHYSIVQAVLATVELKERLERHERG